jgi:SPP1 gp7 family putative phage head morphogenesis protein
MVDNVGLMPVKFAEAIAAMESRGVVLPSVYYQQIPEIMRSYTFSVAGMAKVDQLENVLTSLNKAIDSGQSFNEWVQDIRANKYAVASLPDHRLDNIFRTNVQSMYNRGRAVHIKEHKITRPYLLRDGINDSRIRKNHLTWDGFVAQVDNPIWGQLYPPLPSPVYRCRCTVISLSERQAKRYLGEDAARLETETTLKNERIEELTAITQVNPRGESLLNSPIDTGLKKAASRYQLSDFAPYLTELGLFSQQTAASMADLDGLKAKNTKAKLQAELEKGERPN